MVLHIIYFVLPASPKPFMENFKIEVNVSGTVDPEYAADIIERVSLGNVNALYVTDNGATSYSFSKDDASKYMKNIFSGEPELYREEKQEKSDLYYFEKDGESEVTPLPTPLNYEGPEKVKLQNLAFTESKQLCYTLRTEFSEDSEEFVELRNSYSYDIPQIETEEQIKQFFELVGSLDMLLED